MKWLLLFIPIVLLAGCVGGPLKDYDRSYGGYVDVTSQTGGIEFRLTPAAVPHEGKPSATLRVEGSMADGKETLPFWK